MWICASEQVAFLLQYERRIELGRPGDDEFRSRSRRVEHRTRTSGHEWLACAAVCTEHVVGSNASAAKTAVDGVHLRRFAADVRRGHAVVDPALQQLLEMMHELVSQLARRAETIFRFVLDRAHQD